MQANSRTTAAILLTALLFLGAEASAQQDGCFGTYGNGVCDADEKPGECVVLDDFVLEICPAPGPFKQYPVPATCLTDPSDPGSDTIPCVDWLYVVSDAVGGTTKGENQINYLLPENTAVLSDEGQVLPDGDPTTNFGVFDELTFVLRIPFNVDPTAAQIFGFSTSPAAPGPRPVMAKVNKKTPYGLIIAPSDGTIPEIQTTTQSVTTSGGVTLTLGTGAAGNISSVTAMDKEGNEVPVNAVSVDDIFLCVPTTAVENPIFPTPEEYECELGFKQPPPDRSTTRSGANSVCGMWYLDTFLEWPCS